MRQTASVRTLVTGGAGFIGSHLVDSLIESGHEVTVLDNLVSGYRDNVNPAARLIEADVTDPAAVAKAVAGAEIAFHLAAARSVLASVHNPLETDRINSGGSLTVLEVAREAGVRRVVITSSSSVYGGAAVIPTPESASLIPRSPYAVSKLAGEHYARVYWELHGVETVALRLFNVFGPRQRPDSAYAAVIPLFIQALSSGQPPTIHGDGVQSRDFTFVSDAVDAFLAASNAPADSCAGRVYNVACNREHTLLELVGILQQQLGVEIEPVHTDPRPGDIRHSRADSSAAERDLGWVSKVAFEDGLTRTINSLRG
jgi:nucleoside-diphosphate-sugar epimerase